MTSFLQIILLLLVLTIILSSILSTYAKKYYYGYISVAIHRIHSAYRSSALFHAAGRLFFDSKQPKGLSILNPADKVSDRCYRVSGLNPGSHTLQGTNTYLIGQGSDKILIDTGEDITSPKYLAFLFDSIFPVSGTKTISKILLTHGHGDHQGGVVPILKECEKRHLPIPIVYKCNKIGGDFPARGFDCKHIKDGQLFKADDETTIRAIYAPGHTDDHVAFILEEDNALLSGDCVLGCGTTVFDDLYEYMRSLKSLRDLMVPSTDQTTTIIHIYPGHGPIIRDGALSKVDEYIAHRNKREEEVMDALRNTCDKDMARKKGPSSGWISTWELVDDVYDELALFVKISAHWNLTHHLNKLLKEDLIEYSYPDLWRVKNYDGKKADSESTKGSYLGRDSSHVLVCDGDSCKWVPKS